MPISRVRRWVPPAPGIRPSWDSGRPMRICRRPAPGGDGRPGTARTRLPKALPSMAATTARRRFRDASAPRGARRRTPRFFEVVQRPERGQGRPPREGCPASSGARSLQPGGPGSLPSRCGTRGSSARSTTLTGRLAIAIVTTATPLHPGSQNIRRPGRSCALHDGRDPHPAADAQRRDRHTRCSSSSKSVDRIMAPVAPAGGRARSSRR
jgi:hypothetical protein